MISVATETTPLISMCSACVFHFAAGSWRKEGSHAACNELQNEAESGEEPFSWKLATYTIFVWAASTCTSGLHWSPIHRGLWTALDWDV